MSANAYFKCYPSDFLNGIIGLTAPEIAVYTVTMMMQYDRREPVRPNIRAVAARCSLRPSVVTACIQSLIDAGKLVASAAGWSNPRAEKEIGLLNSLSTVSQQNGNRGGRKVKGKANENNASKNPELTQREPDTRSQKPEAPSGAAPALAHVPTPAPTREGPPLMDLAKEFERRVLAASPAMSAAYARAPRLADLSPVTRWLTAGYDLEADILPPVLAWLARGQSFTPNTWGYFEPMITETAAKRAALPAKPAADRGYNWRDHVPFDKDGKPRHSKVTIAGGEYGAMQDPVFLDNPKVIQIFTDAVRAFNETGEWDRRLRGPRPDEPGHYVPAIAFERAAEPLMTPERWDAMIAARGEPRLKVSSRVF